MKKRKSLSCSFPKQDPGLCSWSQTVNFSCQAAVFSCCVSDSLVTNEPFIPLRSSSTPFFSSPSSLLHFKFSHVNNIWAAVITGIGNGDFAVNSVIGDTCAGLPSNLMNVAHFHTPSLSFPDLTLLSFSSLSFILLSRAPSSHLSLRAVFHYCSRLPLRDCGWFHLAYATATLINSLADRSPGRTAPKRRDDTTGVMFEDGLVHHRRRNGCRQHG